MRRSTPAEFRVKAKQLVSMMSLEEKVHQTLFEAPAIERLGIKSYNWWNEALHGVARAGVATVFPQAIGLAASFDEDLIKEVATCISSEARAKFNVQQKYDDTDIYKGLTFWSPNVNIFRDPRWGRGHETFGEDPYLTTRMGVNFIEGMQGDDERFLKVAACAKHFCVHSGPEEMRHSFNAVISDQDLYETYLPAFQAAVQDADVEIVMGAYNRTDDEPCCGSKRFLTDILRVNWGFDGHVTSDCWAIQDFYKYHMVCDTAEESVAMAMNAGCDLNCGNIYIHLIDAVKNGLVDEKTLDGAVERLLLTKMRLGMFEEKMPYSDIPFTFNDCKENQLLNRKTSEECIVLLKNENNILPLDKKKYKTVGIIGPNADNRRALVGNYEGTSSEYVTPLEGIKKYLGEDVRVLYSEGCHLFNNRVSSLCADNDRESEVRAVCDASDIVIAVMGLDSGLEGEEGDQGNAYASGDKPNLNLPGLQEKMLKVMVESGKPVIMLVFSGSALAFNYAAENIPAILQCWYPGAQGGNAIARILFGDVAPSGKLPVTFYKTTEELPEFTDYAMKNRTYRYMENEALYPFGYGLSYNEYEFGKAKLSTDKLNENQSVTVTVDVTNRGSFYGAETVQVYVKAPAVANAPKYQLKGLKKVFLEPGETKTVEIELPYRAFGLYDENADFAVRSGEYTVYVGAGQPDHRTAELSGKKSEELKLSKD